MIRKEFTVKPADKTPVSKRKFSLEQIKSHCALPILKRCFRGQDFTASDLKDEVSAFADYKRSNSIGDALGHAHKNSLKLYCSADKTPRHFLACYENAALVFNAMLDSERELACEEFDLDEGGLFNKISLLPKVQDDSGDVSELHTDHLTRDVTRLAENPES